MLKQIQKALRQSDFDAVLITSPQNRRYVTGFLSSAGVCVIDANGGYLFTDFRYIEAAEKHVGEGFTVQQMQGSYEEMVQEICSRNGIQTLGFEDKLMAYADYAKWEQELSVKLLPMGN